MTKWAFLNLFLQLNDQVVFVTRTICFVKDLGSSSGACDVCMTGILLVVDLVTGLLGVVTSSGKNWSFFPFFLAC
jgi:hypothetical protein